MAQSIKYRSNSPMSWASIQDAAWTYSDLSRNAIESKLSRARAFLASRAKDHPEWVVKRIEPPAVYREKIGRWLHRGHGPFMPRQHCYSRYAGVSR